MNVWLLLFLLLSLTGCGPEVRFRVQVTGYHPPGAVVLVPPPASFYVLDNPQAQDPALEQKVKAKIEKLLSIKGYVLTSFEQADYYLVFAYGQGQGPVLPGPGPVYGPRQYPYYRGYGYPYPRAPLPDYYRRGEQQLYDRWLLVNVIEGPRYRAKKEFQRLWQGEARSRGYSPNLQATVNFLLVALFEDFGKSTGRRHVVELDEEDFRARQLFW
jgi:hypothetical protein